MNVEQLQRRLSGRFRPFLLKTSDGETYEVRHPHLVLVSPRAIAVVDDAGWIVTLDPIHVVAVQDIGGAGGA